MANKRILVGILAVLLVFGLVVVGCDNGSTGGGDEFNLDELLRKYMVPKEAKWK
jgi:hypothetical protein